MRVANHCTLLYSTLCVLVAFDVVEETSVQSSWPAFPMCQCHGVLWETWPWGVHGDVSPMLSSSFPIWWIPQPSFPCVQMVFVWLHWVRAHCWVSKNLIHPQQSQRIRRESEDISWVCITHQSHSSFSSANTFLLPAQQSQKSYGGFRVFLTPSALLSLGEWQTIQSMKNWKKEKQRSNWF